MSLPDSVPKGIYLWLLEFDLTAPIERAEWSMLDEEERCKANRFHHHADRVRMALTRAALRRELGKLLGCSPKSLLFEFGPNNKPELKQKKSIVFNVSHSGAHALVAINTAPSVVSIGVDIEQHEAALNIEGIVEYAFTQSERKFLSKCIQESGVFWERSHQSMCFFINWVCKEAALKSVGVGIGDHLQDISISILSNGQLAVKHENANWLPINVCQLDVPKGYSAAIAWQERKVNELYL